MSPVVTTIVTAATASSRSPRPRLAKGLGRELRGIIRAVLLAYWRA
uniref:Uncharacterized protein n=1 Tax=Janibacter limosus TaxID=53458 RepID=A0AC61U4B4_9MICO|nr:hypothetical protein [Janibacter limosus]